MVDMKFVGVNMVGAIFIACVFAANDPDSDKAESVNKGSSLLEYFENNSSNLAKEQARKSIYETAYLNEMQRLQTQDRAAQLENWKRKAIEQAKLAEFGVAPVNNPLYNPAYNNAPYGDNPYSSNPYFF